MLDFSRYIILFLQLTITHLLKKLQNLSSIQYLLTCSRDKEKLPQMQEVARKKKKVRKSR